MRHNRVAALVLALSAALVLAAAADADSIFDIRGLGGDWLPAVGPTRALGGAVAADLDPLSASIINPCAAARAKYVILTGGFAHMGTKTDNLGEEKTTVTTFFPSLAVTVPLGRFSLLAGLFQEKAGRVSLADTGLYAGSIYDARYKRHTSFHSVPVLASAAAGRHFVLSAGPVFAFCDLREESVTDFRSDEYEDTDDVMDTFATGAGLLGAFVADLGRVQVGGLFRTGPDLKGRLERTNGPIGLWSSEDTTIPSEHAYRLGFRAEPASAVAIEADYELLPWSGLKIGGVALNDEKVDRWSVGLEYRGDYVWPASRFPLNLGYRRGPLDWHDAPLAGIRTGEITEEIFSLGTSIPLGQNRAAIALAFEVGSRRAEDRPDLKETTYGISMSLSAIEAWRKEIKR